MSPKQLREVNAKVEGRDPPETAKETMAAFRALTTKLLKVPMSEVKEQQALYDRNRKKVRLSKPKKTLNLPPSDSVDQPLKSQNSD